MTKIPAAVNVTMKCCVFLVGGRVAVVCCVTHCNSRDEGKTCFENFACFPFVTVRLVVCSTEFPVISQHFRLQFRAPGPIELQVTHPCLCFANVRTHVIDLHVRTIFRGCMCALSRVCNLLSLTFSFVVYAARGART